MTYKEKVMKEHPDIDEDAIEDFYCPSNFGYDEPQNCTGVLCADCWNREVEEEKG